MINPLDYNYDWTTIGWSALIVLGLLVGHYQPLPKLWDKLKTTLTPEAIKLKAEMEAIKAKFETQNSKDIQDLKAEVAILKAKINPT